MTTHREDEQATVGSSLLTAQEQAVCNRIATGKAPHSQRAFALLTLNQNSTQAHAADQAGLSTGQVRYWLAKFRKEGLGIFPHTLLEELDTEAAVEPVTEIEGAAEPATDKVDSAEDRAREMKAKKHKRAKEKTIEDQKNKKGKKTKKSLRKAARDQRKRKGRKTKKSIKKTMRDRKKKKGEKIERTKKTRRDRKGKKTKKK